MSIDTAHSSPGIDRSETIPWRLRVRKRPYMGLIGLVLLLTWTAIAHTISVTFHLQIVPVIAEILDTDRTYMIRSVIGGAFGLFGFYLVWSGFKKSDTMATLYGWMAGNIIWIGWFEETFEIMGGTYKEEGVLGVDPLLGSSGYPIYSGNLLLMESMVFILLAFLILLGANKDTRCRMFLWFQKHFRLKSGKPTIGYRRQFSRITALETLTIKWVFYVIIILFCDPRVLGSQHWMTYGLLGVGYVWGAYLCFYKLPKISDMGLAIRYAIPAGSVLWMTSEILAVWRVFKEPWLNPFDSTFNTVLMGIIILTYIALMYVVVASEPEKTKKKALASSEGS